MKISQQLFVFRSSIFLSAFLLFSIQPMIAKILLPWFGGSAAVWTVSLVFFTTSLLIGYVYADRLGRCSVKMQYKIHVIFLLCALFVLLFLWNQWGNPFTPSAYFKPNPNTPIRSLFLVLGVTIGAPYFLLSSTTPLIQSWFYRTFEGAPYQLYSLSNIGSLGALLLYPIIIEPLLPVSIQGIIWALLFCCLVVLLLMSGYFFVASKPKQLVFQKTKTSFKEGWMWSVLSAVPALCLILVTNTLTQGIASVPFLWILPLTVYLFTFIFVFADIHFPPVLLRIGLILMSLFSVFVLINTVSTPFSTLFCVILSWFIFVCFFFHQWLYQLRPRPERLTTYYLFTSFGGAFGTILTSVCFPLIFVRSVELLLVLLCLFVFSASKQLASVDWFLKKTLLKKIIVLILLSLSIALFSLQTSTVPGIVFETRNFYGPLSVEDTIVHQEPVRILKNGRILHGVQRLNEESALVPTTYYSESTGIGQQIRFMQERSSELRLSLIGLGSGTLASYCREGDSFRFYEIDPDVISIAQTQFTFLDHCPHSTVVLGDARLSLEQEQIDSSQPYDLIAIDAFTDDSIPVHLLTKEAFGLYLKRLNSNGVIAVHISNRFLNLVPVVKGVSEAWGLTGVVVENQTKTDPFSTESVWVLVSKDSTSLSEFSTGIVTKLETSQTSLLWTDAFSNLFQIIRF